MTEKMSWNKGEAKLTLSQCSDCKNNTSIRGCEKFGTKPDKYALNKDKCPEYEKE